MHKLLLCCFFRSEFTNLYVEVKLLHINLSFGKIFCLKRQITVSDDLVMCVLAAVLYMTFICTHVYMKLCFKI